MVGSGVAPDAGGDVGLRVVRAARRWASSAEMSTATSGFAARMSWKPALSIMSTSTSVMATTVAVRSWPVSMAISPKHSPAPRRAISRGVPPSRRTTRTSPRSIRKKLSPAAPSSRILSPAA